MISVFRKDISGHRIPELIFQLAVSFYGGKIFTHERLLIVFSQIILRLCRLDLIQMFMSIFDGMIALNQLCRRLLTNTRHTWNIIGGVSHQTLHINKFRRRHAVQLLHIDGIIILRHGAAGFGLWNLYLCMIRCQLQEVAVAGYDDYLKIFLFCFPADGAQNVIRLDACLSDHRDTHGSENFFHQRYLLPQFFRHRFSRSLIFFIFQMPEGRLLSVKSRQKMSRFFLLHITEHDI